MITLPAASNPASSTTHPAATPTPVREAHPLTDIELSPEQRNAGQKIWSLVWHLAAQANAADKPSAQRSASRIQNRFLLDTILPLLDSNRTNQVVLIDGTRGAGKTTLLVTLVQFWSDVVRGTQRDRPKDWCELATGSVIPLDILDMSPLPVSTNLLVMLASGFQRTIQRLSQQMCRTQSQPLTSEAHWRSFLEVAGSAWDGNLTERRRDLDADSYVAELETVELHRLELRSRFASLIDALTDDLQQAIGPNGPKPIWLVPIDDADMNPGRAVELLEMLRSLHHPRVVFLLTGESGLFLDKLRAHYLGVLTRPLQGCEIKLPFIRESRGETQAGNHTYSYSALGENLYERARRLAQDVYLKIIPPAHRCEITELDPSTRQELMKHELSKMHFHVDPVIEKGNEANRNPIKLNDLFVLFNQSANALPSRFRTVNVLRDEINSLIADRLDYGNAEDVRKIYNFLCQRWHYQLDNSDLDDREIERLHGIIELSSHGEITVNLKDPSKSDSRLITFEPENDAGALQKKTGVQTIPGDMLEVGNYRGFRSRLNGRGRRLPEGITATLLWTLSMAPYSSLYRQRDKLSARSLCPAWCMVGHFVDRPSDGMKETLWLGWPIPDWESPFLWMQMDKCWRLCLQKIQSDNYWNRDTDGPAQQRMSTLLAINFIHSVLYVCECSFIDSNIIFTPLELETDTAESIIENLYSKMAKLADLYNKPLLPQRQIDQAYWILCRFPLLASSESGIDSGTANLIYKQWKKLVDQYKIDISTLRTQIERQRKHRIVVSVSKFAPGFNTKENTDLHDEIFNTLKSKLRPLSSSYEFDKDYDTKKSPTHQDNDTVDQKQ